MSSLGVDVSGYQTLAQVQAAVGDAANGFVIVKASEGMHAISSAYAAQVAAVRASGKLAGAYHFAWPNQDPAVEAANFAVTAGLKPGELACLDMERTAGGETWATRVAYALAWCDAVKASTGATPLVYVNWTWIKGLRTAATPEQWAALTAYPCWLAEYTNVPGNHSTVTSQDGTNQDCWPIVMHQYGSNAAGLDGDYTPDLAALRKLAKP